MLLCIVDEVRETHYGENTKRQDVNKYFVNGKNLLNTFAFTSCLFFFLLKLCLITSEELSLLFLLVYFGIYKSTYCMYMCVCMVNRFCILWSLLFAICEGRPDLWLKLGRARNFDFYRWFLIRSPTAHMCVYFYLICHCIVFKVSS